MPKKLTIEYVKSKTKQIAEGYVCLSEEYINSKTKLEFKCNKNHKFLMTWNDLQSSYRCSYCAGNRKKTIEEVKEYVKQFGYECLSNEYKDANTKLEFTCDKGHTYKATLGAFSQGKRCRKCSIVKRGIKSRKDFSLIKKSFEIEGYILLTTEYKSIFQKLNYICPEGHNGTVVWANWSRGARCLTCYNESKKIIYTKEDLKRWKEYKANIWQITNENFSKYYYLINPNNIKRNKYENHLDHIYSRKDGFNNNVPPKIISSPINLQMLTAHDNISKKDRSDISLEILYETYTQFEKEVENGI